jgi:hypothetical protein
MQNDLVQAGIGVRMSGAPPEAVEKTMIALATADDTLNWVLGDASKLGELQSEYNRKRDERRSEYPTGPESSAGDEQSNPA